MTHTDSAASHSNLKEKFVHQTVNHAVSYVRGEVTTNALENFWSLLKRNLNGTYVAVDPSTWTATWQSKCSGSTPASP